MIRLFSRVGYAKLSNRREEHLSGLNRRLAKRFHNITDLWTYFYQVVGMQYIWKWSKYWYVAILHDSFVNQISINYRSSGRTIEPQRLAFSGSFFDEHGYIYSRVGASLSFWAQYCSPLYLIAARPFKHWASQCLSYLSPSHHGHIDTGTIPWTRRSCSLHPPLSLPDLSLVKYANVSRNDTTYEGKILPAPRPLSGMFSTIATS